MQHQSIKSQCILIEPQPGCHLYLRRTKSFIFIFLKLFQPFQDFQKLYLQHFNIPASSWWIIKSNFDFRDMTNFLVLGWPPWPQGSKMSPTFRIGPQGPDVRILEDSLKNDDALSSLFSFQFVQGTIHPNRNYPIKKLNIQFLSILLRILTY